MHTHILKQIAILYSIWHFVALKENVTLKGLNERRALERQSSWLRCMARRQVIYIAMRFQTKGIAFLVTEGQSITLESLTCLLPQHIDKVNIHWRFLSLEGATMQYIVENGEKYFVDEIGKDLELNDITQRDSGFYFLNINYLYDTAVYFVEVAVDDPVDEIKLINQESEFKPEERVLPERNLKVTLRLYDWTPCSRCDEVGLKTRLAICFVQPDKIEDPIKPTHYPIFDNFFGGVPCKSSYLPEEIKNLTEVKNTKSIQLQTFCQIKCPTREESEDFVILDIKSPSALITKFKTKLNIFSKKLKSFRKLPKTHVFQEQNKGVILKCPGKTIPGIPVIWKKNDSLLIPQRLVRISHGRIVVDSAGRIRFRKVLSLDADTYSCMSGGRHVGTIQLTIRERFQPPANLHAESYANMATYILTLIAMIYISWKAMQSRRHSYSD
ncbi:hypothetical protein CHUAL_004685 [Chamberlinius hualienensis]